LADGVTSTSELLQKLEQQLQSSHIFKNHIIELVPYMPIAKGKLPPYCLSLGYRTTSNLP